MPREYVTRREGNASEWLTQFRRSLFYPTRCTFKGLHLLFGWQVHQAIIHAVAVHPTDSGSFWLCCPHPSRGRHEIPLSLAHELTTTRRTLRPALHPLQERGYHVEPRPRPPSLGVQDLRLLQKKVKKAILSPAMILHYTPEFNPPQLAFEPPKKRQTFRKKER